MGRGLKIGIGAVVGLVVVVVVVVVFLLGSLDSLIVSAVEKYGSEATQAKVRLADVEISPTSGEGALRGLFVGNPKGFETPSAFELGGISVKIDIGTVTEDTIVIKEIIIDKPVITYELGAGGSNIDALKRNVNSYAGAERKASAGNEDSGEGPKLIIESLKIIGGQVNVSSTLLKGRKLSAPLPTLQLRDIGKKKGGASPAEVIERVLDTVSNAITKSVASLNLGKILGDIEGQARGAVEGVTKGAAGAVEGVTKGAGGAVEGVAKGAEGAVKKLFGN